MSYTLIITREFFGKKYEKSRANMLAEEGYIGLALDLFGAEAKLDGFEDYKKGNKISL